MNWQRRNQQQNLLLLFKIIEVDRAVSAVLSGNNYNVKLFLVGLYDS